MSATPLLYSQNIQELSNYLTVPEHPGDLQKKDKKYWYSLSPNLPFEDSIKNKVQVYYNSISDKFPTYEFEGNVLID